MIRSTYLKPNNENVSRIIVDGKKEGIASAGIAVTIPVRSIFVVYLLREAQHILDVDGGAVIEDGGSAHAAKNLMLV